MKKINTKSKFSALIFCLALSAACSSGKSKEMQEISINDASFDKSSGQDATKISAGNSEVKTSFDDFGNRIETRYFSSQSDLSRLTLKTFADGHKEAFVYGQNGERRSLPDDLLNRALTVNENEIGGGNKKNNDEASRETELPPANQNFLLREEIPTGKIQKPVEEKTSFPTKAPENQTIEGKQKTSEQKAETSEEKPPPAAVSPKEADKPAAPTPIKKSEP